MSDPAPPDEPQPPAAEPPAPVVPEAPASPPANDGRPIGETRSVGLSILWAIITLWIYTYIWVFKTHNEVKEHTGNGVGGWLGFIIYLVFFPITWFLVPAEIKSMYERDGRTSPVGPWRGLWVLFPILGPFFWFIPVQGALNDYWMSKGAPAP